MIKTLILGLFFCLLGSSSWAQTYTATVVKVVDGDTINVSVPAWTGTPFNPISLRIYGIDTPETSKQFAKCVKEVKLGKLAQTFARTLVKPGDTVNFTYLGHDKYFRIDAAVKLPDGTDWKTLLLSKGFAAPYLGGKKSSWCK
ncbi:MAG: nuclease [Candidatus Saccharibacteria bacterium]|nr:nuclease [Candidatus Saccharibacteria bacterium]